MIEVLSVSNMNGHLQNQLTKSLERILEEAHLSGELKLSGRKLKDFPKTGGKYDLSDTVIADLSKNKFWELPPEVLEFLFIEKLHLYHNALRSLPDGLGTLQYLKFLDLSRNQLCVLPAGLCQLEYLEVLLIANNKLSSLPNDIGGLKSLMELNASCNEISHLPRSMGQLKYLRALDFRKNLLEELPIELTYLKLTLLDMSENRISSLPVELRLMTHLERLILTGNPLVSPPPTVCMRGRVHIFKFLETQVHKTDKKRTCGMFDDVKRNQRKSDLRYPNGMGTEMRVKRHTVDSGYSTSDGMDPKWTQDYKYGDNANRPRPRGESIPVSNGDHHESVNGNYSGCSTPSTISPGESFNNDDEIINRTILLQDQLEAKRLIRLQSNERGYYANKSKDRSNKIIGNGETGQQTPEVSPTSTNNNNSGSEEKKRLEHVQTYREYKEARRLQRAQDIYRLKQNSSEGNSPTAENPKSEDDFSVANNHLNLESSSGHNNNYNSSNQKPVQKVTPSRNSSFANSLANGDSGYLPSYVKPSSPVKGSTTLMGESRPKPGGSPLIGKLLSESNGSPGSPRFRSSANPLRPKWNADLPADKLSFTMRREFEKAKEEAELIDQLRQHIEGRLKMSLPEDMGPALMDGVVLCHLANYVRPRSVASIHVPSPAVPKLTMARCRRNVDNFLDACRKIGVEENLICFASDILEGRGLVRVSITVSELLKFHTPKSPAHVISS